MERLQADSQQLGRPRLIISSGVQRLQDQLALHRVHGRADRELDRRQIARPFRRCSSKFPRQAGARDQLFFAHDWRALQYVTQFADIPRPGVAHEDVQYFRADSADVLAMLGVDVSQNMFHKQGNVLFVIAERRQIDVEDIQAEIKILA